jgi:hypothetical protein
VSWLPGRSRRSSVRQAPARQVCIHRAPRPMIGVRPARNSEAFRSRYSGVFPKSEVAFRAVVLDCCELHARLMFANGPAGELDSGESRCSLPSSCRDEPVVGSRWGCQAGSVPIADSSRPKGRASLLRIVLSVFWADRCDNRRNWGGACARSTAHEMTFSPIGASLCKSPRNLVVLQSHGEPRTSVSPIESTPLRTSP